MTEPDVKTLIAFVSCVPAVGILFRLGWEVGGYIFTAIMPSKKAVEMKPRKGET